MLVVAEEQQWIGCSANKCGNITISHPFWLPDRATGISCGSPDFEVTCKDKITPVILTSAAISLGFAILRVSYEERSLHVVDLGKLYLLQHAPNSCLVPIWNTSAKLSAPFTISPGSLGLVLYSCPEAAGAAALALGGGELVRTGMRCGNESQVLVRAGGWYNGTGGYGRYKGCDYAVTPVLGANAEANASDYVRLIDDGFFLTWELPPPPSLAMHPTSLLFILVSLFLLRHRANGDCKPLKCGNLAITYPFWLGSPSNPTNSYCGHPSFEIWCTGDGGRASLRGSAMHVIGIDYDNSSFVVSHSRVATGDDGLCRTNFNMSSSLALSPFRTNPSNMALCFLHNCNGTERLRPDYIIATGVPSCGSPIFAYLGGVTSYDRDAPPAVPVSNCTYTYLPVLGSEAAVSTAVNYRRLLKAGFTLQWPGTTVGDCVACNKSDGLCRYKNSTSVFACLCPGGSGGLTCAAPSSSPVSHKRVATGSDNVCGTDFNISSSLALSPYRTSHSNMALCFLHNCNGTEPVRPDYVDATGVPSCGSPIFVYLGGSYDRDTPPAVPVSNCKYTYLPVLGSQAAQTLYTYYYETAKFQ
ncbi:hypothetical protein ZWY2020_031687 [Hordeum vulgare]|nr:hypothetical protein ZWY2020_031687 [Hordeum vulgare]